MLTLAVLIIAYLLGSISSSIIICKLAKLPDPRSEGSNNPGATNVLRIGGKKVAAFTLLGDMFKGILAVAIGQILGLTPFELSFVALAAFLGHLYPIFFKFKGGKGVATALGTYLALYPPLGVAAILTWLIVAFVFRFSSLAALAALALTPFYSLFLATPFYAYFLALMIMTLLSFWRHRENIMRLYHKKETKIGQKKKDPDTK